MRRAYQPKPRYVYLLFTRDEQRHTWTYHSTVSTQRAAEGLRQSFAQYGTAAKVERKRI